uniref:tRNA 5-methylaminomethyl-2-thiouridine biosynthesis bifunctional protein MnmC n=4 Tax=unclassified bacterial viruses TaxID=12333 RepID=A0AAU6W0F8_9VIRU
MGFFKKLRKVVAKFDLGHQLGKKMGLPDPSGDLFYGSDKALSPAEQAQAQATQAQKDANTQAELARQQAEQQAQQLALMQANMQTDLKGENLNTVVAGGSAEATSTESDIMKRRKASGLSSTIGLV